MDMGCQLSHSFDTVATMPPPCSPHLPPCSPQCSTLGGARKPPNGRQTSHQGDGREPEIGIWEQQQQQQQQGSPSWEHEGSTLGHRSHPRTLSRQQSCTMRSTTLRRRREEGGQCRGVLTGGGQCMGSLGGQGGQCGTLTFPRPPAWSAAVPHHDLGPPHHSEIAWR